MGRFGYLKSMYLTLKQLFRKPFTVLYPQERIPNFERYRGIHLLNMRTCKGCNLCGMACPNFAIKMVERPNPKTGKMSKYPEVDLSRCMFCGLCEDACPLGSLKLGGIYDFATHEEDEMIFPPEKLAELWEQQIGTPALLESESKENEG